jgi:DNA-binding transcriptional ArsR family regulator
MARCRYLTDLLTYRMVVPDAIFAAIADPRRRAILEYLREGERNAGEIADRFDVSWPAISRHLRILRSAGLVREMRAGRNRVYDLNQGALVSVLTAWVTQFRTPPAIAFSPSVSVPTPVGREYAS